MTCKVLVHGKTFLLKHRTKPLLLDKAGLNSLRKIYGNSNSKVFGCCGYLDKNGKWKALQLKRFQIALILN